LRMISILFAQMRQTTPASGGSFFYKGRSMLQERWTNCRCFIHRSRGHREWRQASCAARCSGEAISSRAQCGGKGVCGPAHANQNL